MSFRYIHVNSESDVPVSLPAELDDLKDTPIHPVWRRAAFREVEFMSYTSPTHHDQPQYILAGHVYNRMAPALRLASVMLQRMDYVFERIMFAPVVYPTRFNGVPRAELHEHFPVNDPYYVPRLQHELLEMSRSYRIFRHDRFHADSDTSNRLGMTDVSFIPGDPMTPRSCICEEFLEEIDRPDWPSRKASEKYAILGLLGATLVHELAHALWRHRNLTVMEAERTLTGTVTGPLEPYYQSTDTFIELGTQLEIEMYGGGPDLPLLPNSQGQEVMNFDGKYGLTWSVMSRAGHQAHSYCLSRETNRSWFHSSTWETNPDGTRKTMVLYMLPNPEAHRIELSPDLDPQPTTGPVSALQMHRCSCKVSRVACPSPSSSYAMHSP